MRILHVGFGFRPWLVNGLVIHSETVMDWQVRQGYEVAYFFPARQLPVLRRPFLHRWRRGGVQMFELVNSDLVTGRHLGTASPGSELHHACSESAFLEVVARFGPELIHVHDLGGLPSSILELGLRDERPVVLTIHDYHSLCPTVKLYDADGRICLRPDPGAMCAVCCRDAPADNGEGLTRTAVYAGRRLREASPWLDAALRRPRAQRLATQAVQALERSKHDAKTPTQRTHASADDYQRRRDVNVERLNGVSALIASSERSAQIFRQLGVTEARIEILPINPPHIERLRPRRPGAVGEPLRFVALNACSSTQKGADLIAGALARLSARGLDGRYRLSVHGPASPHVLRALNDHPSVDLHDEYEPDELDQLLEHGDVGLLPSVWEEVYGYVGLEYLAKAIPVIGNAIGAIPEYVRPNQTGWLNQTGTADELAELMASAIEHPEEVKRLGETTAELRAELIEPSEAPLARLTELYAELVSGLSRRPPARSPEPGPPAGAG
jgi:glycosyltransferase involved in cell wall biosynthesis